MKIWVLEEWEYGVFDAYTTREEADKARLEHLAERGLDEDDTFIWVRELSVHDGAATNQTF